MNKFHVGEGGQMERMIIYVLAYEFSFLFPDFIFSIFIIFVI